MKPKKKQINSKRVNVAKGISITRGQESKLRKKPGSSNVGKYKNVKPEDFAGAAGGASKYSFPINSKSRARNALARAHFVPNPAGIKAKVYKEYPELEKKVTSRKK